jgi:tRNA-modifying protein YgfZ
MRLSTSGDAPAPAKPAEPTVGEIAGRSVVLAYGSAEAEYQALREHAVVVDRSHRTRLRLEGPKAVETVTGLVTNDIGALEAGQGCYAAALTPKGKIVADLRIFREGDAVLVDSSARAGVGWLAMVRKYVNPRMSPYRDVSAELRDIGVFGANARHVVSAMTGVHATALGILTPFSHVSLSLTVDGRDHHVVVARVPDLGLEGFELFAPADAADLLWTRAVEAKAVPMGLEAWDVARVEAGRPEWGVDADDNTIAQEANFDELHAISYTKGCYVGQEVVARVHFRGHVNRHLRGLRAAGAEPPRSGAVLFDDTGKQVGDVRSAVSSPRLGGLALGMVRREVELGTSLVARWHDAPPETDAAPAGAGAVGAARELRVDVTHLPFPA